MAAVWRWSFVTERQTVVTGNRGTQSLAQLWAKISKYKVHTETDLASVSSDGVFMERCYSRNVLKQRRHMWEINCRNDLKWPLTVWWKTARTCWTNMNLCCSPELITNTLRDARQSEQGLFFILSGDWTQTLQLLVSFNADVLEADKPERLWDSVDDTLRDAGAGAGAGAKKCSESSDTTCEQFFTLHSIVTVQPICRDWNQGPPQWGQSLCTWTLLYQLS